MYLKPYSIYLRGVLIKPKPSAPKPQSSPSSVVSAFLHGEARLLADDLDHSVRLQGFRAHRKVVRVENYSQPVGTSNILELATFSAEFPARMKSSVFTPRARHPHRPSVTWFLECGKGYISLQRHHCCCSQTDGTSLGYEL